MSQQNKVSFQKFVLYWNLKENYEYPLTDFHERLADWLESTQDCPRRLLMAYRSSGKSTMIGLYVAWRIYCDPNFTCIFISATHKLTKTASMALKNIIENHPLTNGEKGPNLVPSENSGHWQNDRFTVIREKNRREPTVSLASLGSQITGMRADMVIADDIETHNNVKTHEGREDIVKAARELASVAEQAVLFIGTPHDADTIYNTIEYKWNYETAKYPVRKSDGSPQCPERHGEEWIKAKMLGGDEDFGTDNWWQSQYMLVPTRSMDAVLNWEGVKFYNGDIEENQLAFNNHFSKPTYVEQIDGKDIKSKKAYWDPASSVKGRDQSIIACVAKSYENEIFVHDALVLPPFHTERAFDDQHDAVIRFAQKYKLRTIVVEKNFSLELAVTLKKKIKERGLNISVVEDVRTHTQNKNAFIGQAIEPYVQTGKFYVHHQVLGSTSFKRQFQDFPHSQHDDVLDAVAGCIHALGKVTGTVGGAGRRTDKPINTYQPTFNI